ncbi:serine/threonine-protein kinase [Roseiconus lacunae]|uniref:hypothetical protein n=1 Tax=Roseiconus lacunae TaxID=2605694 RepID=UPI001E5EAEF0|nr:hypothetical protein [Roseiconus lacunae]MCD0458081.1 hypothetical protein [Roseiconus lacunae]
MSGSPTRDHDSSIDPFDDSRVSIDELGTWLKRIRAENPTAPLIQLLDGCEVHRDLLVDLAALDLMLSWRRGHRTPTEDYLKQFPELAQSESSVLDLIDAEMCICRELKVSVDIDQLTKRFPDLATPILQLAYLDGAPIKGSGIESSIAASSVVLGSAGTAKPVIEPAGACNDGSSSAKPPNIGSSEFELQRELTIAGVDPLVGLQLVGPQEDNESPAPREDSIDVPLPIKPPDWMIGAKCIATTLGPLGRSWLVKGRDADRGDVVVMKVIPFPQTADQTQKTRILDLCEQASNVSHPCWVPPRIAAMNRSHLAVIRPWVFGTPLSDHNSERNRTADERLALAVRAAFAIAAAHRSGATHGSVRQSNMVLGHDHEVRLIDVGSSLRGWDRYFQHWHNDLSRSLAFRISSDTQALARWITGGLVASGRSAWVEPLCVDLEWSDAETSAVIGERLQAMLDRPPREKNKWWGRR